MKTYSYKDSPLEMHGLPFFSENHIIERVPSEVREKVPSLAFLGRRPAGARLCFRTNSKNLRVKMTLGTLSPDIGMSLFACQSSDVMIGERSCHPSGLRHEGRRKDLRQERRDGGHNDLPPP